MVKTATTDTPTVPSDVMAEVLACIKKTTSRLCYGVSGIGKSKSEQIGKQLGRNVIDPVDILQNPTDLRGIPLQSQTNKMDWAPR